eukprot:1750336-Pleurochrysis_carterae.AAC.3
MKLNSRFWKHPKLFNQYIKAKLMFMHSHSPDFDTKPFLMYPMHVLPTHRYATRSSFGQPYFGANALLSLATAPPPRVRATQRGTEASFKPTKFMTFS